MIRTEVDIVTDSGWELITLCGGMVFNDHDQYEYWVSMRSIRDLVTLTESR